MAQSAWFIKTQPLSDDEPLPMVDGPDAWRYHRFERWNDHPLLVDHALHVFHVPAENQ